MVEKKIIENVDELEDWNFKFGFYKTQGIYEAFFRKGSDSRKELITEEVYEELKGDE